ncbi:MAG: hypothetical protein ACI8YQ_003421 [Polaribacter sp.]|jgi:hypothetical protein
MKNITLLLLLSLFLASCSTFNEENQLPDIDQPYTEIETTLPLINITVDQDDFDEMYNNPKDEIEIEATFNLYRNKELLIKDEIVELEIKGNYSTRYDLRSIGVKFDDKYDNKARNLINPERVLPHHNIDKIKSFRLRNSGSDFVNTMIKDLSFTQLAINAGLNIDLTYGEPSLVYVNNIFYGLLNIRTESNTHGIAGLNGVSKKDLTMVKVTTHELIKKDGDFERVDKLVNAISRKDIPYLKEEIDLASFIDYMIFQSYLANTDWPHNNARFYAVKEGKFRFVLFDLDKVSWLKMEKNPLTIIEAKRKSNVITDLFFALYDDVAFKDNFWNRYRELLNSGDISSAQFVPIVERNKQNITKEIQMQIAKYQSPETMMEWEIEIDKMMALFEERAGVVGLDLEE